MYSDSAVSISIQKPEQSTSERDTIRHLLVGLFRGTWKDGIYGDHGDSYNIFDECDEFYERVMAWVNN